MNITAKSLPEAIDLALDNLGVDEAEAEIEVLEEPKQGLFGRTRGNARVKARVKPKETRPKQERGRNRRRRSEGGGGGGRGGSEGRNRNRRSGGGGRSEGGRNEGSRSEGSRSEGGRNESGRNEGGRGGGRGGERGRSTSSEREQSGTSPRSGGDSKAGRDSSNRARDTKNRQADEPTKEVSVEEVSAHVESFLSGLVEAFGVDGGVRIDADDDDGIIGVVEGQHGLMVGPKGRTLESIQELTRVTAQRSAPSNVRIKVDVGGYRAMRAEALQRFAMKAAEAALADGKERALEPMNSADRKIVHDALNEVDGIETRSAGTDPRRRVVVVPLDVDLDDEDDDDERPEVDTDVATDEDDGASGEAEDVDAGDDGASDEDSANEAMAD
ncbi:MAG: RNA-binding cell elongation regulator Jag/EloR [Actinomycetota bacterium]